MHSSVWSSMEVFVGAFEFTCFSFLGMSWDFLNTYCKSLKETRDSYSFVEHQIAGLIQGRVSFEGGSY